MAFQDIHVFVVPNAISYLVGMAVMRELDLARTRCVFVCARDFEIASSEISWIKMPFSWGDFPFSRRFVSARKVAHIFDNWIDASFPSKYVLYLPHYGMPQYQLMATHPKCLKLSYLEEGTAAYFTEEEYASFRPLRGSRVRERLISFFSYSGRVSRAPILFKSPYDRCFGLLPESFPGRERVSVINLPMSVNRQSEVLGDRLVLAPRRGFSELWSLSVVQDVLDGIVRWCEKMRVQKVSIKAHPGESRDSSVSSFAKDHFGRKGIEVVMLGQSVYLENMLCTGAARVIGFGSSIELYGELFGGRVISGIVFGSHMDDVARRCWLDAPKAVQARLRLNIESSRKWLQSFG